MTSAQERADPPALPRRTISSEVTFTFLVVGVAPLILSVLVLGWIALTVQVRDEVEAQDQAARQAAELIESRIDNMTAEIDAIAKVRGFQQLDPNQQRAALSELIAFVPEMERAALVTPNGREVAVVSSNEVLSDADLGSIAGQPQLEAAARTGGSVWGVAGSGGRPSLVLAVPLIDPATGEADEIIVSDASLNGLRELLQTVNEGSNTDVYAVNSGGEVVLHQDIGVERTAGAIDAPVESGLQREADGSWVVRGTAPLGQSTVVVEESVTTALSGTILSLAAVVVLAALAVMIGLWMRARLNRRIVDPIGDLADTAERLGAGDMTARAKHGATREVAILARTFNEMADSQEEDKRTLESTNSELRASNQNLTQFASVASHDLQEPLRTIISYLDLIEHTYDIPDSMSEDFQIVSDSAHRMRSLIADLLTYSRLGVAKELEEIQPGPLLTEVQEDLAPLIEATGASVTVHQLPPAYGVASRVRRVFQNLIENAIKYRDPARTPAIDVSGRNLGDGWVEFEVTRQRSRHPRVTARERLPHLQPTQPGHRRDRHRTGGVPQGGRVLRW